MGEMTSNDLVERHLRSQMVMQPFTAIERTKSQTPPARAQTTLSPTPPREASTFLGGVFVKSPTSLQRTSHFCMNYICFQNLLLSVFPAPRPLYLDLAELKLYLIVSDRSRVSYIFFDEIQLMASYSVMSCLHVSKTSLS